MTWRHKEPWHQQLWYWHTGMSFFGIQFPCYEFIIKYQRTWSPNQQSHMAAGKFAWKKYFSVPEKLSWFIRHLSDGQYSIQICEISHQTFGPSHRKCPTCLMIFMNTDISQFGSYMTCIRMHDDKLYSYFLLVTPQKVVIYTTREVSKL